MSITVDTVQLRFQIKPDYDQQQIQQLQSDLKQSQKNIEAERKEMEKYARTLDETREKLRETVKERDNLAKQKSRTAEEMVQLGKLNQTIEEYEEKISETRNAYNERSKVLSENIKVMRDSEDRLKDYTCTMNIHKMSIAQLGERQKELNRLVNALNPQTDDWETYKEELDGVKKRIAELRREELKFHEDTRLADLTLEELNERLQALNVSFRNCDPNGEDFQEYADEIKKTKERISELNDNLAETKESLGKFGGGGLFDGLKKTLGAKLDFGQLKTFIMGSGIVSAATFVIDTVADYAGRAFERVKSLVTESIQAARAAEGITHAFQQLDQPGLLQNLRRATHGTVTDLELMKAAVQANDFRLPLDQLGKYLEFAQLKAQQTGQSVDYMTSSIVTGLGRKSLQILDNLGLSAAEVKEEMEKTGDMATAVDNIIDRQLSEAGEHFEDAAEREARATTDVSNAQLRLGQQMKQTFGIGTTSFSEMQAKAEVFILNGLTKLIVYCQSLYNRLGSVRLVVETVKAAFDTVFKVCEVGFLWLIDVVKGVARVIRDLAGMIEGVFTFDWEQIKQAGKALVGDFKKNIKEFLTDGKDVGQRWGRNVLGGINAVMGKYKVQSPEIQTPKLLHPISPQPDDSPDDNTGNTTPNHTTDNTVDKYKMELAAREKAYREYGNSLRRMLLDQLLTEEEYQEESLLAESKFLAEKISLQKQYGQDSTQTQGQYLDMLIRASNNKQQKEKKQLQERLAKAEADHATLSRQLMEQRLNGELDTEKRYNELKLQADIDYQKRRLEILKAAGADTSQVEQQLLQLQLQQQQQHQQEETESIASSEEKRKNIKQATIDAVNNLLSSSSQLFSAMQQREISQVEAKYKKLIDAAKKQGKDTTKLEEKLEKEKSDIQKKYAEKQFMLNVLQIVASTATGIARLWKDLPFYAALPLTAVVAASGAAQLASAKMAADQAAGLYSGGYSDDYQEGYTRKGDPRKQAGVIPVHQNEFVANHRAVANPEVRPVLDVIDRHQRAGDIHMLNSTRLLEEAYGRGRYCGGYSRTAPDTLTPVPDDSPSGTAADRLIPILTRIEQNTARSLTVRTLREEIAHEEQLERNARR